MNPRFQVGPVSVNYYGLVLTAAILTAFQIAKFQAKKLGISQKIIEDLAIILIIPTILGARIYHVLHNWGFYSKNPAQIFYIWQGGIGILGAIVAGILVIFLYSKFAKVSFLKLADVGAVSLPIAQSIGRFGNFINSEGFGPPTGLPWGVNIAPEVRPTIFANFSQFHPTFFYEAAGDFLIFLILISLPEKNEGTKFATYLVLYSALRFGLEFLRIDTWQLGILKVAQAISVFGFLAGAYLLFKVLKLKWTLKFFT